MNASHPTRLAEDLPSGGSRDGLPPSDLAGRGPFLLQLHDALLRALVDLAIASAHHCLLGVLLLVVLLALVELHLLDEIVHKCPQFGPLTIPTKKEAEQVELQELLSMDFEKQMGRIRTPGASINFSLRYSDGRARVEAFACDDDGRASGTLLFFNEEKYRDLKSTIESIDAAMDQLREKGLLTNEPAPQPPSLQDRILKHLES